MRTPQARTALMFGRLLRLMPPVIFRCCCSPVVHTMNAMSGAMQLSVADIRCHAVSHQYRVTKLNSRDLLGLYMYMFVYF